MTKQKVRGVGRDGIDERSLWVHFDFPVTDDDMRAFHDFARGFHGRRFDDPLIASLREAATHAEETYNSKSIAKTIRDAIAALTESSAEPNGDVPTPQDQLEVLEAAVAWAYCPDAGGYRDADGIDGLSVEDCCERLSSAVRAMTGKDIESPAYPNHWTYAEMRKAVTESSPNRDEPR